MTTSTERFEQCYATVLGWVESLERDGWLSAADSAGLKQLETAQAEVLFDEPTQRPLLVAFFGGTGVGKSSLLNRLAGKAIANVGVVRPTSHHVTLYLHESYRDSLHTLALPTKETRIVYHADDTRKYFAWLDMPDIDSTEQSNRAVVESWLPVIDWLIYVVTPDRYNDDLGWQFVQARGHQHAWLFVMNHWDEGVAEQWNDFRARLVDQGFTDPVVLRTSCTKAVAGDEFKELEAKLQQALQDHGIDAMRHAARARRWQALQEQLTTVREKLAQDDAWDAVKQQWNSQCEAAIEHLSKMLNANAEFAYQQWKLAEEAGKGKIPALRLTATEEGGNEAPSYELNQIFDGRCNNYLQTLGLAMENIFSTQGLPLQPVQVFTEQLVATGQENYLQSITTGLANSLKKPGNLLTRALRRLLKTGQWLLPLVAALWAGFHIVSRFYSGTQGEEAFLGINFAVHSLLMIGLAWLIPWFVLKQTQPSYAKAALGGINQGIEAGSEKLQQSCDQAWLDLEAVKADHLQQLKQIQDHYARELSQDSQVLTEFMS